MSPGCSDARIMGTVIWNLRVGKPSSWDHCLGNRGIDKTIRKGAQALSLWRQIENYHEERYLGSWETSLLVTWHPRKNWVRQWYSLQKQSHRHLGQRSWHQLSISYPLSYSSLWENQMVQWTVKRLYQEQQVVEHSNTGIHYLASQH